MITGPSGVSGDLVPLGYEQITVSSAAVGLSKSQYAKAAGVAIAAFCEVATAAINVRDDGTDPTTTVGVPFAAAQYFWLTGSSIGTFKAIAQGADATLNVAYYRRA